MKITIEIDTKSELEKLTAFFKTFKIERVKLVADENSAITRGDKSIDPSSLFGIWAKQPKTLDDIRNAAWKRK
ncbi:hypothetical protein [Mucilaginibacter phyllosphaerae]|uniref:Uncharacterized protein n=1 Tax=Mucilaginibacter phyllosphaerae TaxID=1812349 RepID=A0A4Y8ADQ0_9SPHI|nr:hypothetical protein [Mucilaginibacter phyllosphaerae]MBB3970398.1 hypothetical protein [Mucilaginibacter phyllosphaerae]TEW66764.1 hypothetical protein E2R65_10125 [Mucilaginibacter phyllosphaerae]GGH11766.1 hypothetical protein GCM10007352_18190 [Mucilaginibacter phyllosphaerae]